MSSTAGKVMPMNTMRSGAVVLMVMLALLAALPLALAEDAAVEERAVDIMSDGVRMHGTLYYPKGAVAPLATIILSHGWGGTAAMLTYQATEFAKAGYLALAFDYRLG